MAYPSWRYYPARERPPTWVSGVVTAFAAARSKIDTQQKKGLKSDAVLKVLRPALLSLNFEVEAGKKTADKIRRPVLFGDEGAESLTYEVDGFNSDEGIALEIEAGRGALGNADYRDLIQTSLLVDARYLVLALALEYHYTAQKKKRIYRSYATTCSRLDAIYASERLKLPLDGVLLIGY